VASRSAADKLRDLLLEIPESELAALPEGEYYRHQLIGLQVRDAEDQVLGTLEEILDTGANDVYVVRGETMEYLIPAIDTVVRSVDLEAGVMRVQPLPGMEGRETGPASRLGARVRRVPSKSRGSAPDSR
jgi:16S rRNA processing protein RimM